MTQDSIKNYNMALQGTKEEKEMSYFLKKEHQG